MSDAEKAILKDALEFVKTTVATLAAAGHPQLSAVSEILSAAVTVGETLL